MKNAPLYICDGDSVYLDRLSGYIMGKAYSPFLVKTVTGDNDVPLEDIKDGILLISSNLIRDRATALDVHRTIILNEGELSRTFENFKTINKFQPAGAVYQQLLQYQLERDDVLNPKDMEAQARQLKIIGVYSPVKRIGKTALLRQLCEKNGKKEKILLISMEEFSKSDEEGEGLSELIYYYKRGKLKSGYYPEHLIRHQRYYDYILPVRWVFDLKEMSARDWCGLFEAIQCMGIYDSVWIDFDGIMDSLELLGKCEKIYVPYVEDAKECIRLKHFEEMLSMMPDFSVAEKIQKVLVNE